MRMATTTSLQVRAHQTQKLRAQVARRDAIEKVYSTRAKDGGYNAPRPGARLAVERGRVAAGLDVVAHVLLHRRRPRLLLDLRGRRGVSRADSEPYTVAKWTNNLLCTATDCLWAS